jgi:hypothetical protein
MPQTAQVLKAKGHPSGAEADRLRSELDNATKILTDPCISDGGCDWQSQQSELERAAGDLNKASGG